MATDTKDTLDASHAGTLVISCYDLFPLLFGVPTTRFENTSFTAVFAPELLTTAGIVPVLDYVGTATSATHMSDCFCYHVFTIPSLQFDQYHPK